jgi:hypothetical protein
VLVRGPERLHAWRVVADPVALDSLDARVVLRIAPDDALVRDDAEPAVHDPHAIVVAERGFVGWELGPDQLGALAHGHIEWQLPAVRPAAQSSVAQGLVAQVPAKLWLRDDGTALLMCAAALSAELQERMA